MKNKKTILLVEDEELLAMTETRWLKKAGYDVINVFNGEQAIAIVYKYKDPIDLILMDINLGSGIDGIQAAKEILHKHDIPIIFLSSHTEIEIIEKTEQIASYGYIIKDSKEFALLALIKMALKLHNVNKELKSKENSYASPRASSNATKLEDNLSNSELHQSFSLEQLKDRLQKFQMGINHSEDAIFITDKNGRIEFINKAFEKIYGYNREEIIGKTPRIMKSNLLSQFTYEQFWSTLLSKNSVRGEIQNKTKDGRLITIDGSNNPILDDSGEIIGFLGIHRDVTERKYADNSLQEREELFRLMVETSPDMTMVQDKDGFITFLSRQAISVIGHDPEKIKGQTFPSYIHPEDSEIVFKKMLDALTGKEINDFEYRFIGQDGEVNWLSHTARPLIIDGELISVFSTVRNITERKNTEIKLRESEEKMRILVEGTPYFFFYTQDTSGNVTYISPSIKNITGYSVEDWIGQKHWFAIDSELNNLAKAKTQIHLSGKDEYGATFVEIRHANGGEILLEVYEHPVVKNNKVIGLQGVAHDITMRKRAEEELKQSEERFRAIFENNSAAIAIINPDTTISMVNDAYCQLSGYTKEEVCGINWTQQIPPDDLERLKEYNRRRLLNPNDAPNRYEFKFYNKNGEIKHGLMSISLTTGSQKIIASFTDITEHKNAEESLQESELQYKTLFENANDAIIIFEPENEIILEANHRALATYGFSRSEFIGMSLKSISKDVEVGEKQLQQLLKQGTYDEFETEQFRKDGTVIHLLINSSIIDYKGKTAVLSINRDISERKRIYEDSIYNHSLLDTTIESTADGILVIGRDGKISKANQKFADLMNIPASLIDSGEDSQMLNFVLEQLKDPEAFIKKVKELYANPELQSYDVLEFKDGRFYERLSIPQRMGDEIIGRVWNFRDITTRKKVELVQKALYEISEATFIATDMDALYKRIHEVISTLITAKNFYIAIYDEKSDLISFPYFVDEFDPPQPTKKTGKGLTEYVLRNGRGMLVDSNLDLQLRKMGEVELIGEPQAIWLGVPLKVNGKTIGVIVCQDYENENAYDETAMQLLTYIAEQVAQVIERKRSSDEIQKISDELLQLNQTKDKFFSIISHDLKNPFQSINSALKLLLSEEETLTDDERNNFLHGILNTSTKAYSLLENLLVWSRHQMGKIDYKSEKIELYEVIVGSFVLLRNSAFLKNITLINKIERGIYVIADRNMLDTVIRNIITNAIKFTREDGTIVIESKIENDLIEIMVIDNGIGIPAENLKKLFRIDQSISTQGTKNETGTGLGLILCKEFVEKNNGTIHVESEPGIGTKISFTLPIVLS
ncbi:MAG: PAS domain S-box protein [Ignavibacteriales bacterium]|nr:PAS domain S-box protein [Ignavibacteriales bacterium]